MLLSMESDMTVRCGDPDVMTRGLSLDCSRPAARSSLDYQTVVLGGERIDIVVGDDLPSTVVLIDEDGDMVAVIDAETLVK